MLTSFKYNKKKRKVEPLDVLPGRERFAIRQKTLRDEGGNSMIDRVRLKPINNIDSLTFTSGRNIPPRHVRFKLHHNNVEKGGYPMWTNNDEGGNFVPRPPPLGGILAGGVAAAAGGVAAAAAGGVAAGVGVLGRAANLASGVARNLPSVQSVSSGIANTFNYLRNGVPSWLPQRPQQGGRVFQPRIPQQPNGDQNQPLLAQPPLPPQLSAVAEAKGRARSRSRSRSFGTLHFNEKENELKVAEAVQRKLISQGAGDHPDAQYYIPAGRLISDSQQSENKTDNVNNVIRRLQLALDRIKNGGNGQTSGGQAQLSSLNNSVPMLPDVNLQDTPTFATLDLQQGAEYKTPSDMKAFYEPLEQPPPPPIDPHRNRRRLQYDEDAEDRTPLRGQEGAVTPHVPGDRSTRNLKGREPYMRLGGAAYIVLPSFASNSDPMFVTQGDNTQGVEVVEAEKWAAPRKLSGKGGGLPRGPRGDGKLIRENAAQGVVIEEKLRRGRPTGYQPTAGKPPGDSKRSRSRSLSSRREENKLFEEREAAFQRSIKNFIDNGGTPEEAQEFAKKMESFYFN